MTDEKREQIEQIEDEITYRCTVDALIGVHHSGTEIREYRDIVVRPSDNPSYDQDEHDLTDAGEREWWETWCRVTGEYRRIQAAHSEAELEAIAIKAGYTGWADVDQSLTDAADDDVIIAIQESVIEAE